MITVFDRRQIMKQRLRASSHIADHDFLFRWAMDQIADRLSIIRRSFPLCVQIGSRGSSLPVKDFGIENCCICDIISSGCNIACDEEFFPFAPQSLDLVVSSLCLHTVNDLPGALLQIRQSLKPDGLFLAAVMGGETLHELRACLGEAELEITGGQSPRVAPFADKPQMGSLMQRAGFALPVIDSEILTVTYGTMFNLMHDLRHMGEGNAVAARLKNFTSRKIFMRAAELYAQKFSDPDGRIRASFEIIFLLGWAPDVSQQKPLRPGSADIRLADALQTFEFKTGEKPQ